MKHDLTKLLSSSPLFCGLNEEEIECFLRLTDRKTVAFQKGEKVFYEAKTEQKIGFITFGKCDVLTPFSSSSPVRIRTLEAGECFGLLSVFCPDAEYPTVILAASDAEVLFFGKDEVKRLIRSSPQVAENVISFLADRVSFLNAKLRSFCEPNAEKKLASYLLYEASRRNADSLPFSATKVCAETGIPRPSLYRAVDSLTERGMIRIESKTVSIDRHALAEMLGR